jgi:hypothetical protein
MSGIKETGVPVGHKSFWDNYSLFKKDHVMVIKNIVNILQLATVSLEFDGSGYGGSCLIR